jgi:hypothetical protein
MSSNKTKFEICNLKKVWKETKKKYVWKETKVRGSVNL